MFGLTFFIVFRMGVLRAAAVKSGKIDPKFFRLYQEYEEPDFLRAYSRHVVNLHEAPVIFYAISIIAYVTDSAGSLLVALAWGYVALRFAHSYVHLTTNRVLLRFKLFALSYLILVIFCVLVFFGFWSQ